MADNKEVFMKKEFLTIKEASEITGLSIHTVRNRVESGRFKTLPRDKNEKVLIFRESIFGGEHDRES